MWLCCHGTRSSSGLEAEVGLLMVGPVRTQKDIGFP